MSTEINNQPDEINIRDIVRMIWRRRVMIVALVVAAVLISSIVSLFVLPKVYKSSATVAVTPQVITPAAIEAGITIDDPLSRFSPKTKEDYLAGMLSDPVLAAVIDELDLNETSASLRSAVTLTDVAKTDLIEVSVAYSDAQTAQEIAQALCATYEEFIYSERQEALNEALETAEEKMVKASASLQESESQLEAFIEKHDIEELRSELSVLQSDEDKKIARIRDLDTRLAHDCALVSALQDAFGELDEIPADEIDFDFSGGLNSFTYGSQPIYETSGDNLTEVMIAVEYMAAQLRIVYYSAEQAVLNHEIDEIEEQIEKIEDELEEFGAEYDLLNESIAFDSKRIAAYRQRVTEINDLLESGSGEGIIQTTKSPFVSSKPVSPNVTRNVLLAGVLALFLGLAVTYFLDVIWVGPTGTAGADVKEDDEGSISAE
ncbi:MAG: hypothetical protein JW817_04355 [Clostridiales bacterium]|nr:hypothetical protein [Clostridiales bacterium]